ncbi:hypothetical protein [Streptomyces sp. NPDC088358]|uniref:hypothetical protein n=1 Tax=Streptomyces sp. NPDC088358 TaxID=3365857 RepID=UPI0037FC5DCD
MTDPDSEWRLWSGSTLIDTITVDEAGMPWQHGRFLPEPAFSQCKPWFDKVNAIVERRSSNGSTTPTIASKVP